MKPYTDEKVLQSQQGRLGAGPPCIYIFCVGSMNMAIDAVPVGDTGDEVDWGLSVGGSDFTLAPFRRDPLEFAILAPASPNSIYRGCRLAKRWPSRRFST
jgi:hypothetical protein